MNTKNEAREPVKRITMKELLALKEKISTEELLAATGIHAEMIIDIAEAEDEDMELSDNDLWLIANALGDDQTLQDERYQAICRAISYLIELKKEGLSVEKSQLGEGIPAVPQQVEKETTTT